jgi:hypothetical protein
VSVDNRTCWLDPTAGFQRGPLAARSWPNYGYGLIVRPKTTGLEAIPEPPVPPRTTVVEYVLLRLAGQPADLRVVTIADGADADALRRRFFPPGRRSEIAAEDLNAFGALYPGVIQMAPLEYADDERANEVVVTEYYQVGQMWSPVPTGPGFVCHFYSYNIDRAVPKPPALPRAMPLGLSYPEHQVFRVVITLPISIPVQPNVWTVNCPAFHFHKAVSRPAGNVLVELEYDALAGAAPVEAMPGLLPQLGQVAGLLGYTLFSY